MSQPAESPHTLFQFEKFRFTIRVTSLMVLPPYKGSILRGVMGNFLRRILCTARDGDCEDCAMRRHCLYTQFFESLPAEGDEDARKFCRPPPPYILVPPLSDQRAYQPGDIMSFELVLIGKATKALPY